MRDYQEFKRRSNRIGELRQMEIRSRQPKQANGKYRYIQTEV